MNPMDLVKAFIGGGGTPEQFLTQKILGNNANPMINNLIKMAKGGNNQSVEQFARNMFNEQGRNFDKEFAEFMNNFKR